MLQDAETSKADDRGGYAGALLDWYDRHARALPWRIPPARSVQGERPDPYKVWLSEIMLQQTQVATVRDYWLKFVEIWPNIDALAAADEEDVLKAWAGLGYYSRARNLKKCAQAVVMQHGGRFPQSVEVLKTLPGIGDYTAAAIAAIAFNNRAAVVDGNVERVITRLRAIDTPLPAAKAQVREIVDNLLPQERPGDFAQAMMDLGATLCSPKRPACSLCPVNSRCAAYASGEQERFPVKAPKAQKPTRKGAAFVAITGDGKILLERRPDKGLLASMTQVPTTGWNSRADGETHAGAAPFAASWRNCGRIRHVFTHFELDLTVWHAKSELVPRADQWLCPIESVEGEALPTVMKKVIALALGSGT